MVLKLRPRLGILLALACLWGAACARPASAAERPTAPHLLPKDTVAYVRIANMPELREKFQQTMLGRIGSDEKIKPLVSQLYGAAANAIEQAKDRLGAGLDDLLSIPQGEVSLAAVIPTEGPIAIVAIVDVGDRLPVAQKLLTRGDEELNKQGALKSEEKVGEVAIISYSWPNERDRNVSYFVRDNSIILASSVGVLKQLLATWDGGKSETLANNLKFTSIMKRCGGAEGERPQISFFIDPIELAKKTIRGAAATGLALLPVLGLDGVEGVGGSVILATSEWDSITHLHLLLDNPRSGIPAMLALRSGDTTPEPFIPADAASYMTLHWSLPDTYKALAKLFDSFRGQDALASEMKQRLSQPLGIDFQKDIIEGLDGRVSVATWMVRPARLNSRVNLVALKVKDAAKSREVFEQVIAKFEQRFEKATFGGVTYYSIRNAGPRRRPEGDQPEAKPQPNRPAFVRQPDPCFAMIGDYLILTDSSEFLHHAIMTQNDSSQGLANQLEFKLIASKIRHQPGGDLPGMITFNRPEEALRLWYDLATAEDVRGGLSRRAEGNAFFGAVNSALRDNPLPPFSVISQYLAPGGGLLTNDETGFHYTGFTLKRE